MVLRLVNGEQKTLKFRTNTIPLLPTGYYTNLWPITSLTKKSDGGVFRRRPTKKGIGIYFGATQVSQKDWEPIAFH